MANRFTIQHKKGAQCLKKYTPSKKLSLGQSYESDIMAISPFLPSQYPFIKKRGKTYDIYLLKGMSGSYSRAKETVSIESLIELEVLNRKKEFHILTVPEGAHGAIEIGESVIEFAYLPGPSIGKKKKLEKGLSRPFIKRADNSLYGLLVLSLCLHLLFVNFLSRVEIPVSKIDDVSKIPKRLAKFVFKPPPKAERQEVLETLKKKEKPKEKPKQKKKEPKKPKKVKKSEEKKVAPQKSAPKKYTPKKPSPPPARKSKVAKEALLGVFTAKKVEQAGAEMLASVDRGLDDILGNLDKKTVDPSSLASLSADAGEAGDIFDSSYGGGDAAPQAAAASDRSLKLKEKKSKALSYEKRARELKADKGKKNRSKEDIDKVVRAYTGGLKFLYRRELRKDTSLRGKVVVKFTIAPSGKITYAEIMNSTLNHDQLVSGIKNRIMRWKFPALDVAETTVIYPFVFLPTG